MSVRETIDALRTGRLGALPPISYPSRTKLASVLERLVLNEMAEIRPRPVRLERVAEAVRIRLIPPESPISSESFVARDWRVVPWVMWSRPPFAAEHERFLNALEGFITNGRSRSTIKALTYAYLAYFDASKRSVLRVARFLRERAFSKEDAFGARWLALDHRFSIFDPEKGPNAVAQYAVATNDVCAALCEAGIERKRLNDNFASCAFNAAIDIVAQVVTTATQQERIQNHVEQLFAWNTNEKAVRYAGSAIKMADALLSPLRISKASVEIKERIVRRFVELLGDPRFQRDRWVDVSLSAQEEAMRILVRTTLDDFFRVIGATVENRTHWKERREFWWAYYESGAIRDAWVALGSRATDRVEHMENKYARFRGATPTHSALILRIENLIIVESSHNGCCWFFPRGEPGIWSPGCYDKEYDRKELHLKCRDDHAHKNSSIMTDSETLSRTNSPDFGASWASKNRGIHVGEWRPRFAMHIFERTGIKHPKYGMGF